MSLKALPKIKTTQLPDICAFELDEDALGRFNPVIRSAQTADNTIDILDTIGEDMWGEGVSLKYVSDRLRAIGSQEVFVDINSPGGDFFTGIGIYNLLREHPAKVNVRIIGLAASAASVIAMAGDTVSIARAGFLMIHNAWVVAIGNRRDLAQAVKTLEPFDAAMASLYAEKAGGKAETFAKYMDQETYFNGDQAIEVGLADSLLASDQVTEDKSAAPEANAKMAIRHADIAMAKGGMPRSKRRDLLAKLKGTQDATQPATQDAGKVLAELERLKNAMRS